MSGFNNDKADAEFFPDGRFKSNFLCCLGHGDGSNREPRLYRFAFDEVARCCRAGPHQSAVGRSNGTSRVNWVPLAETRARDVV